MSNPTEPNLSPPAAENSSLLRSPKKLRLWRWLIVFLVLAGAGALWRYSTWPSLTPLGVKEIKGNDYLCFVLANQTTDAAAISVYVEQGSFRTRVPFAMVSKTDRGLWKRAEIGIPSKDVRMVAGGMPIRIRVQSGPKSRDFTDKVRRWLSAVIPARYLYADRVLASEPFVP